MKSLTLIPSFLSREKIEWGPRQMERFWSSTINRIYNARYLLNGGRRSADVATHSTRIIMINWERESWKERDNYDCSPLGAAAVCPYCPVDQSISDVVLDGDIVYHGAVNEIISASQL